MPEAPLAIPSCEATEMPRRFRTLFDARFLHSGQPAMPSGIGLFAVNDGSAFRDSILRSDGMTRRFALTLMLGTFALGQPAVPRSGIGRFAVNDVSAFGDSILRSDGDDPAFRTQFDDRFLRSGQPHAAMGRWPVT